MNAKRETALEAICEVATPTGHASYERARACVLAFAGVSDPAAFMREQQAKLDGIRSELEAILKECGPFITEEVGTNGRISFAARRALALFAPKGA